MLKWILSKILTIRTGLIAFLAVIIALSLWTVGIWVYENSLNTLSQRLDARINLYSANITSELDKYEYLPDLLSRDPILNLPFQGNMSDQVLNRVNQHLSNLRETADVSSIYIMDINGDTLAASNWATSESFVGQNFKFRPYFQKAINGESGLYYALGSTTKIPGYYLSYPIGNDDQIIGVVVVNGSVARLENAWGIIDENVLVTDENGVIIIASKSPWKFRTFDPISDQIKQRLNETRLYEQAALKTLEIENRVRIDNQTEKIDMRIPTFFNQASKTEAVYVRSRAILGTNWKVHYVYREANLQKDVVEGLIFAAILWIVLILSILFIFQRRRIIENRLQYQLQHQRTLEQAAATLEARVERRTKELLETNTLLENEIDVRREAEKNLTRTQDELVQAGKLAALGQMAAGITHEMNQPLTAIRSYSENARIFLNRDKVEDAQTNLGLIAQLCDRLGVITNQLKVFSRKAPPNFEPVSLKIVVDEAIKLLETGQLPNELIIENNLSDLDIKVMGEAIRLEQVIINILKNAIDALRDEESPKIEINVLSEASRTKLQIRDNGPGIKPDKLSKIFDPFFTTKPSGEGLGLGLSLSSQIIQEFSGSLIAENHSDEGMIFTLDLLSAKDKVDG